MAFGLAGILGNDTRLKINIGSFIAVVLSVFISIISGVVFFGQYAPSGMNVWIYSCAYNISSVGVEGILSIIVMNFLPLVKLKRLAIKQN